MLESVDLFQWEAVVCGDKGEASVQEAAGDFREFETGEVEGERGGRQRRGLDAGIRLVSLNAGPG